MVLGEALERKLTMASAEELGPIGEGRQRSRVFKATVRCRIIEQLVLTSMLIYVLIAWPLSYWECPRGTLCIQISYI
jgi:hypothetical protein